MKTVLLIEPDYMLADSYAKALSKKYETFVARDAQNAIDVIDQNKIDVIISDTLVRDHNGIEIIHEIRSYGDWIELPIIMLSTYPMADFPIEPEQWEEYGIRGFAYKPKTKPVELLEMVSASIA